MHGQDECEDEHWIFGIFIKQTFLCSFFLRFCFCFSFSALSPVQISSSFSFFFSQRTLFSNDAQFSGKGALAQRVSL
jgi:hypothetical protein